MRIDIVTIFPAMFEGPMSASMIGIARDKGLLEIHVHDLRDWTHDRHRSTDDSPYGGGPGMVMRPEPLFECIEAVRAMDDDPGTVIFFTPAGTSMTQALAQTLSEEGRLILICGRYEGFDERTLTLADMEISIGDYILTGGELPAMVVTDAVSRLLPGVLGDSMSSVDESFSEGLLEYPQYTRPAVFRGLEVPEILLSGDHAKIEAWRRDRSIERTAQRRPDLLGSAALTEKERAAADAYRTDSGQTGKGR